MTDKVISLKAAKEKRKEPEEEITMDFNEAIEYNKKNKERIEKERMATNKSVLRSYRIKK